MHIIRGNWKSRERETGREREREREQEREWKWETTRAMDGQTTVLAVDSNSSSVDELSIPKQPRLAQ